MTKLTDLASDALLEIGNVILNSFLGELSNVIRVHLTSKLPTLTVGAADQPFLSQQSDEKIILFWTEFSGNAVDVAGFLSVAFEPGSAEIFKCVSRRLFSQDPSDLQ